jgi:hypothetical protein
MIDLDALRKKHEQLQNAGGDNTDFQNMFFQVQEGTNTIRILPPKDEDKEFYAETQLHRVIMPDGNPRNFHCRKMHNEACPLCDAYQALWAEHNKLGLPKKEDSEFSVKAREIKPRSRYYLNIMDRQDENKVKVLSVGVKVFNKIISVMLDPDFGDITDLEKGFDFKIKKMAVPGSKWPAYDESGPRPKSAPAGNKQEIAEALESLHDIHGLIRLEDYDATKEIADHYIATERPLKDDNGNDMSEEEFMKKMKS